MRTVQMRSVALGAEVMIMNKCPDLEVDRVLDKEISEEVTADEEWCART